MQGIASNSYWHDTDGTDDGAFPSLTRDLTTDVVVIGGGITGLTAALHLKQAGRMVAVLEAGRVGDGTTGGTSGHLDIMPDCGMRKLIRNFGQEAAAEVTAARAKAISQIEQISQDSADGCGFARVPAYRYTEDADGMAELEKECDAARSVGVDATITDQVSLPFPCAGGVRIERQAKLHALHYVRRLAQRIDGDGCHVFEHTLAQPPESGTPCTVDTPRGRVSASAVVVATHSAFMGISQLDMRVTPYLSYALVAHVDDQAPDALYWDDEDPYHYTRLVNGAGRLLVGGADRRVGEGHETEAIDELERYVRSHYRVRAVEQRWSAELFEPDDGLPYIGAMPMHKHIYIATGLSGTGLTLGTVGGELMADLILNRENRLADILSPGRIKPIAEAASFIRHNVASAGHMIKDRLGRSAESGDEPTIGSGRVVRHNGDQIALYRDEHGELHAMSPVCRHAGCIVHWNDLDKTWDCPCHGGRYSATGKRLYGPPAADLEPAAVPAAL